MSEKQVKLEKTNLYGLNNNFEIIVGSICLGIAIYIIYRNMSGLTDDVFASNMIMMINTVVGMFLFMGGLRRYRFMKKYNRYVDIINNAPDLDLKHVSDHEGVPLKTIMDDFGSIIRLKILAGAYVDKSTGWLVMSKTHDYKFMKTAPSAATARQLNKKEMACDECGAMNEIEEGYMTQCSKCGHLLVDD